MEKYKTFKDFYPYYIEEHSKPKTKLLHFIGTSISLFFLVQLVITFDPIPVGSPNVSDNSFNVSNAATEPFINVSILAFSVAISLVFVVIFVVILI